jgi:hypothetical protein
MSLQPGNIIRKSSEKFELWRSITNSRKEAKNIRKTIVDKNGYSAVDAKTKAVIAEYCQDVFKDKEYWPWLATYTEIRGKFIEGWIPEDYYRYTLLPQWNPIGFATVSTIKTFDHRLFNDFSLKPLLIKVANRYFDSDNNVLTEQEAIKIITDYNGEIVIKKDSGPSGSGIIFIHTREFDRKYIDVKNDLVIQPKIEQLDQFDRLNKSSVNTFRVFTFLDSKGEVHVKKVFIRYGVGNSRIDNVMSGGGYIPVQDGAFSAVSYNGLGFEQGDRHPDSGFMFKDLEVVSFYDAMVAKCVENHLRCPYVQFIGWDVAIDKNGKPVLVEWNAKGPMFWRYEARLGPFFEKEQWIK